MRKPNFCPHCGNNPTPHFLAWYFESFSLLLWPLRRRFFYNSFSRQLKAWWTKGDFSVKLLRFARALGIVRLRRDIKMCKTQRAQVLWEEAIKRGIDMSEVLLFGRPIDVYLAEKQKPANRKFAIVFSGLPRPADYFNENFEVLDDKALLKEFLIKSHLPAPTGGAASSFAGAKKIFADIQTFQLQIADCRLQNKSEILNLKSQIPVIVKPRTGSRGRHSATFVSTLPDLRRAFKIAKQLCFWVMVEEQLFGPVYRATLINFELCGVLRGDPPQVMGDGRHTIGELIEIKNSCPHPGVRDIVINDQMRDFLIRQLRYKFQISNFKYQINSKLSIPPPTARLWRAGNFQNPLQYVPSTGEAINLSEKIGVNYGGSSKEDFDICHKDNKELFVRAARVLGDPIVGFDFIIPDIAKSYKEQKCGFIEANTLPFIQLHHEPLFGRPRNVAAKVWDMMGM